MDEITLYQWGVLGFLALIAVLIWRVLLAVEVVEKNTRWGLKRLRKDQREAIAEAAES